MKSSNEQRIARGLGPGDAPAGPHGDQLFGGPYAEPGRSIPTDGGSPSAGRDGSIVVVDLVDGRELRRWAKGFGGAHLDGVQSRRLAAGIRVLAFSRSMYVLATDSDRGAARRARQSGASLPPRLEPARPNLLAAGLEDHTIRIWDVDTGRRRSRSREIATMAWWSRSIPVASVLASRGWSGMLRLWDIRTGRQILENAVGLAARAPVRSRRIAAVRPLRAGSGRDPRGRRIRPNAAR